MGRPGNEATIIKFFISVVFVESDGSPCFSKSAASCFDRSSKLGQTITQRTSVTITTLGSGSSTKAPWLLYTDTPLTSNLVVAMALLWQQWCRISLLRSCGTIQYHTRDQGRLLACIMGPSFWHQWCKVSLMRCCGSSFMYNVFVPYKVSSVLGYKLSHQVQGSVLDWTFLWCADAVIVYRPKVQCPHTCFRWSKVAH